MFNNPIAEQAALEERDYLDRVALEAMKIYMHETPIYDDDSAEEAARYSYLMAHAMLKARSQGGAE